MSVTICQLISDFFIESFIEESGKKEKRLENLFSLSSYAVN